MENTNTQPNRIRDALDRAKAKEIEDKRTVAAHLQTIRGMTHLVDLVMCPHCGKPLIGLNPPDDDYDTRA